MYSLFFFISLLSSRLASLLGSSPSIDKNDHQQSWTHLVPAYKPKEKKTLFLDIYNSCLSFGSSVRQHHLNQILSSDKKEKRC